MMNLPPQVNFALDRLNAAGFEAFVVGGAVRDFLLDGSLATDWDITTSARPAEVQRVFSGCQLVETGLKHGTLTLILDALPLEITTYRVDGIYTDHRHPDAVHFTRSLREDLARRDFTINALAYHPKMGLVDYEGGAEDLANGLIRCVGEPARRFQEDALRILRALRFASRYEMQLEAKTAASVHACKALLSAIAPERVRAELTKLLCGKGAAEVLRRYGDVLAVVLPELSPMFGFAQHNPHHDKDVWAHTIAALDASSPAPPLRWAALLHDIGKPGCFSIGSDGLGHFYGHAGRSCAIAEAILSRLHFDNATKERIVRLVRYHDMPITADRSLLKRLLSKHGEQATRQLIELHRADTLAQAAICKDRIAVLDAALALLDFLLSEPPCFSVKDLAIDGHDVMALGFQGKQVGRALALCLDAVLDETLPNEAGALLSFLQKQPPQ